MKRTAARRLLSLALAAALATPAAAQNFETFTVSDIRVEGLQRISAGTVFTYLPVERGDTLDRTRAAEAVRALFRTGFFNDVRLDRQGDILVITVAERPAINKVELVGNKDIKSEDLEKGLKEIGLAEGETFDRLSLDRVTQELTRQYNNRGKYNVSIKPAIKQLDRNRVDVTINITEGKAAKIKHINLVGNETYPEEDIRERWESSESNWLSWYRKDDQYSREKLSGDLEKLNSWYLDRGYVDFNIESTQVAISPDKRDMFLTAGITEGEVYTVSDVKVTGDTILPHADIEKLVLIKSGDTFSRRRLELTSDSITAVLGNIGYAFAAVETIPDIDRENRTIKLNFFVNPGPRVYVRRVLFKGNTATADEVMRRELRQFENAWYSQAAIDRSKIRLQRLGYFEKVDIETPAVPGTDDQVDVVINVTETTSGSFTFGLGYSQLSGAIVSLQLQQNNFLGTGNRVALAVSDNSYQKRYDFSFFDPYFTEEGLSLGYNLWYRELDYSDFNTARYSSDSGAAQAVFGLPITETDTVSLLFGIDFNTIFAFRGTTPDVIVDYIDAIGQRTFHAWRSELAWARDSRNDFFQPTRGSYQRAGLELTLPGSTVEYYKANYEYSKYFPLANWLVLNGRVNLGYGDSYGADTSRVLPDGRTVTASGLPFYENFYAGGVRSVRGFEDNTLGPRAGIFVTDSDGSLVEVNLQPIGGSLKTTGSFEFIFPTVFDSPAARVSAFVDWGNVYADYDSFSADELRASAGVALQWRAPIGPIIISWAKPLRDEPGDEIENLQFTFGTSF